ncbi:Hypothetical predicted protein [Octopus vulgaris]|uniref:Uncharacterized protein n=1 Tax=Octopus vulgaris TaxID=6645 RepID=A0AA36BIM1_OCTVU|nr:Hypothetical predicted protein [Octopus vulgaris]
MVLEELNEQHFYKIRKKEINTKKQNWTNIENLKVTGHHIESIMQISSYFHQRWYELSKPRCRKIRRGYVSSSVIAMN